MVKLQEIRVDRKVNYRLLGESERGEGWRRNGEEDPAHFPLPLHRLVHMSYVMEVLTLQLQLLVDLLSLKC